MMGTMSIGMRIAFVAHHGSIHTRRWAGFFADRGHDVHVITCGDGRPVQGPYHVHDLGAPRPPLLPRPDPGGSVLLRRRRRRTSSMPTTRRATGSSGSPRGCDRSLSRPRQRLATRGKTRPAAMLRRVLGAAELVTVPSEEMRDAVHRSRRAEHASRWSNTASRPGGSRRSQSASVATGSGRAARPDRDGPTPAPAVPHGRPPRRACALARARRRLGVHCVRRRARAGRARAAGEALGLAAPRPFAGQRPPHEVETGLARARPLCELLGERRLVDRAARGDGARGGPVVSDIPSNRAWIRDGENGVLSRSIRSPRRGLQRALLSTALRGRHESGLVGERADRERNMERWSMAARALFVEPGR